ncbi:MAG: alpha/beta hydrolase-fold protein [Ruminococcus bromii]|nr:alpha/beta hydrolase-fold protein [Ruminococcus bromii]MDY4084942.1 alpha/beta hydrolase-fold protein [Ruminococcus bromii]MDY4711385.1 alpha/beta hydrolase-fold protein [Ruminococcus bromii]
MKKIFSLILSIILISSFSLYGCNSAQNTETDSSTQTQNTDLTKSVTSKSDDKFNPYSTENKYDIGEEMFEKRNDVDYGTVLKDVIYFSQTAGDNKQCNILLPAGYNENNQYPVMYIFHGFGGSHSDQIDDDSYVTLLYGNMLHDNLTVPQIIVNVDMYTDKQSEKSDKSDEELRYIYDKAIDDVAKDLMPFIENNYSVKTGRENTAVAGMSEGGAKSLCTGFKWLDKFGYIASFAPVPGVIPTEFYKGTYWNTPYLEEFPQPTDENTPFYLYLAVGSKDPWNIDCTLYYKQVFDEMGIKNQTDYVDGYEHNHIFWRQCFYNFLSKIFK